MGKKVNMFHTVGILEWSPKSSYFHARKINTKLRLKHFTNKSDNGIVEGIAIMVQNILDVGVLQIVEF